MPNKMDTEEIVTQRDWHRAARLTTVQAALGTNKSKATVEALTSTGLAIVPVADGLAAVMYRFLTDANADNNVINMYAIRGNDHYQLIATFTLTGGTQVDGNVGVFCDTIVMTANTETWPTNMAPTPLAAGANNSIATLSLNTHGVTAFLFIATTLAGTLQIDEVGL